MSEKEKILSVMHTFENLSEGEELQKPLFKDNISSTEYYISIRKAFDENLGYILILESIYTKTGTKTRHLFKNFSTPDELTSNINLCKEIPTENSGKGKEQQANCYENTGYAMTKNSCKG